MASYRSTNPLGRFYSPANGTAVIKVDVPANVTGFSGSIAAPHSNGGVFVCGTTDLNLAVNRNWRNLTSLGTMGLTMELTPDFVFQSSSDFVYVGGTLLLQTGSLGPPGDVIAEDMTMSNQRFDRDTVVLPDFTIGTATQIDLDPGSPDFGTQVPNVPVYLRATLDWSFYAYRFWSKTTGDNFVTIPAALTITFAIRNEENFGWDEDAEPVGGNDMVITTNWKVYQVDEMATWNLPVDFPGYDETVGPANLVDEDTIDFEFGDEVTFPNVPIRSYNLTSGFSSLAFVTDTIRWIFPTTADALSPL